ncbi:MAG: hypothetical protein IIC11_05660 [Proteobacteria bacterium]|nr:hypothetical protein [Pseudomonadota bacterium]
MAEGKNIFESAKFANEVASIVVSKKYTGTCTMEEINSHRKNRNE